MSVERVLEARLAACAERRSRGEVRLEPRLLSRIKMGGIGKWGVSQTG